MEDVLVDLFWRSYLYATLHDIYIALYLNNVLIFAVICWFSARVEMAGLSWYLVIIITHRYLFLTIYKRMSQCEKIEMSRARSSFMILKLNMLLFPYYLYAAYRM
jgi:hypothetical protein